MAKKNFVFRWLWGVAAVLPLTVALVVYGVDGWWFAGFLGAGVFASLVGYIERDYV